MREGSSFIAAYQMVLKGVTGTCPVLAVSCENQTRSSWLVSALSALLTDLSVEMMEQYK